MTGQGLAPRWQAPVLPLSFNIAGPVLLSSLVTVVIQCHPLACHQFPELGLCLAEAVLGQALLEGERGACLDPQTVQLRQ